MKILWRVLLSLLLLVVVGPLLIPIPPLKNIRSIEDLADPDSQFVDINGLKVHYKRYGQGRSAIILLHGFGASTFSFNRVSQPLARLGTVVSYDRPAHGLTSRPLHGQWQGENPYSSAYQPDLLVKLMDQLSIDQAILIGNSAGGAAAVQTALKYPERVQALVLVDAAIYQNGPRWPGWVQSILTSPQARRLAPLLLRNIESRGSQMIAYAWHDSSRIPAEAIDGYRKPLQAADWDKALWEYTSAFRSTDLASHLAEIRQPVLVVTGDDDRIVPTNLSLRLAKDIPGAKLCVVKDCGHLPQEECPDQFLDAVVPFIEEVIGKPAE